MKAVFEFIKARWAEQSTRLAIVIAILGAVGVQATQANVENVAGFIGILIGAIFAAWPEKKKAE